MTPSTMPQHPPLLLVNARLIDPAKDQDQTGDVLIENGRISAVGAGVAASGRPENTRIIDCTGRVIGPGLIDMRAFVGEPGAEYRETLASASQAAAAGGVTTIICQPDTDPVIDDPAIVDFVLRRARDTAIVRVRPMAAITRGLRGQDMTEIGLLRAAGAVAFSDGAKSIANAQVMRRALTYARDFSSLIVHHTEDSDLVADGLMNEGEFATRLGLAGIPRAAETLMLERDLRLVRLTKGRYHAASLTCRESLDVLKQAKDEGLPVSASVSINHITLNENDIGAYKTYCKLRPPLRSEEDRMALVEAVATGLIDVVMSDHDPQDVETKRLPFAEAAPGAIGLETMLSAALRLVHEDRLTLLDVFRAMSLHPARLLGLEGGSLAPGAVADLVIFDAEEPWVVDRNLLKSRCKNSPFDEARMTGRVHATLVGGHVVYEYA